MGSTIVSSGERITNNDLQEVFVHGAYNLGAVLTKLELVTTAVNPGMTLSFTTGAAGEDAYLINPDEGISPVAIAEIDFLQISSCATDYAVGDEIPGIMYHMNPGALCRNIVCKDQAGDVADAGKLLTTSSGAAGHLKILTEVALVDPSGAGTGEAFNTAVTWGDQGSLHHNRTPMRQAYYQADASADYDVVAYILNT